MRNCIRLRGKTMRERKERKPDELDAVFDTLMEDMPIDKAYQVKKELKEVDRNLWKTALAIIIAMAFIMLFLCGILIVSDYFGISEKPTDWEQVGAIAVLLPAGTIFGYVICHTYFMSKMYVRLKTMLDDALEEYVKEKSTETGDKPN